MTDPIDILKKNNLTSNGQMSGELDMRKTLREAVLELAKRVEELEKCAPSTAIPVTTK